MKATTRKDSTMPQRSYSYARISTGGRQARGDGLRRQQGKLDEADDSWPERISKEHGWILDDTLRFTDKGRSAFHKKNLGAKAALTRFLSLIRSGRITPGSVLLADKLDRLSRAEAFDALDLLREILRNGVWICTKDPSRIYTEESQSNMAVLFELVMLVCLNHEESAKKSKNVASAWEAARHKARNEMKPLPTTPPSWLRREEEGYAFIPEKLNLVKRVAALSREGMGGGEIAAKMMAEGVPGLGRSGNWSGPAVYQLLTSRTLIGEYQPHRKVDGKRVPDGSPLPGFYPAALTEEEYEGTLASLKRRRGHRGRPGKERVNILGGIVWEATGRRRMSMQTAASHGKQIPYLSWGQISGTPRARYDHVEEVVMDILAMLRTADVVDRPEEVNEREERIKALQEQLTKKNHRYEQLQQAAANEEEDLEFTLSAQRQVKADRDSIAKELQALKLESRTGRGEALAEAQSLQALREEAQGDERTELDRRIRAALPEIVSEIWIQCQKVSERHQFVHVQVWLQSGQCRHALVKPENMHGVEPWNLKSWDLRRAPFAPGDVGNLA